MARDGAAPSRAATGTADGGLVPPVRGEGQHEQVPSSSSAHGVQVHDRRGQRVGGRPVLGSSRRVSVAITAPPRELAGEDVRAIADSPALAGTVADRLRPGPGESQNCELEITTAPLTFTDWARGAAVVGIQNVLGAI